MPESQLLVPSTYAALRQAVETVVLKGRRDIDRAWVQTYHEAGRLITVHLVVNKNRTAYGSQVLSRLSADTGIDKRTLQQCAQFYRCFPKVGARPQLGWAHYRVLINVAETGRREQLKQTAEKLHWTSRELEEQVRQLNATLEQKAVGPATGDKAKLLTPKRGTPGLCRVVEPEAGLAVDLGFAVFLSLPSATKLVAGDFVQVTDETVRRESAATKADLFTYTVDLLKVVDGDTLWVLIGLGRGFAVKQKLRLRDLDCPEMSTPGGKAAKRYVDSLVARTAALTICTTKPDKYDRYLADVFLTLDDSAEIYLNNALLENGHAVVKREWEFGDWGE